MFTSEGTYGRCDNSDGHHVHQTVPLDQPEMPLIENSILPHSRPVDPAPLLVVDDVDRPSICNKSGDENQKVSDCDNKGRTVHNRRLFP